MHSIPFIYPNTRPKTINFSVFFFFFSFHKITNAIWCQKIPGGVFSLFNSRQLLTALGTASLRHHR